MPRKSVRTSDGAFTPDQIKDFLSAEWVDTPGSSMTQRARFVDIGDYGAVESYDEDHIIGALEVIFLDGTPWQYPSSQGDARKFAEASSKGGALHDLFIRYGIVGKRM